MSDDVECPYCGEGQEINHDDGYGYEEDKRHEQQCSDCDKTFTFTTSISYYYEAEKADCLNGGTHNLKMSATYPREYSDMSCEDCDYRRQPTATEFSDNEIVIPVADSANSKEKPR